MLHYRNFRNDDPPHLVAIWNEALTERGAVHLRHSAPLERYVFAKPYFDRAGLFVALENEARVGFAHAGFGPNSTESGISYAAGVTCIIGIRPTYRRRRIGSELLARCEAYLRGRGARSLYAGPMRPLNPFYFGLYGGSESPGFLDSDSIAAAFLKHHSYKPLDACLIFQKRLDQQIVLADARFSDHRKKYDVKVMARSGRSTWWQECALSAIEPLEFHLDENLTAKTVARAELWEMEGFSWRWGVPSVGIVNFIVQESHRRRGLGKFLLAQIIRYLQEQYFGLVEVQAGDKNTAALGLYQSLGFEQVDVGRIYRQDPNTSE